MPRPEGMALPRYVTAAAIDRACRLRPVARLRERLRTRGHADPPYGPDGLPMPPAALRVLVGSPDVDRWMREGRRSADVITSTVDLEGAVLDFGCGCGRTIRHLAALDLELHGCDVNAAPVKWCRANLPFMTAAVNPPDPPAPYPDSSFDVVYAISILTHLTRERGEAWMAEWRRILKPAGTLVVTTHGDGYLDHLGRRQRPAYDQGQVIVNAKNLEGMNQCTAFHPPAYMRQALSGWSTVRHVPSGTVQGFRQDVWAAT